MSFLDVELPENFEKPEVEAAPEPTEAPKDLEVKDTTPETTKEPLDLDKLESFKLNGKDWTRKEFQDAILRREDYTRKTMELSEARKYVDNFDIDLQYVMKNPKLLDEMRKVYPANYVAAAERILERLHGQPQENNQPNAREVNPLKGELDEIKGELNQWRQDKHQAEVTKIETWLDNQYQTLSKKYPFADAEIVSARATLLSDKRTEITDNVLDKLFKQSNEEIKTRFDKVYKEQVSKQLSTGARGKDTGSGGGIPGQAPIEPKTLKEAKAAMLKDLGVS